MFFVERHNYSKNQILWQACALFMKIIVSVLKQLRGLKRQLRV